MRFKTLQSKLLSLNLSLIGAIFLVVGPMVYFGLQGLSGKFKELSDARTQSVQDDTKTSSEKKIEGHSRLFLTITRLWRFVIF